MARKRQPRPRRMSSILDGLGGRECFATELGWREYQDVLGKLRMRALEQVMDGDEIQPARGFIKRQPNKRSRTQFDRRQEAS